MAISVEPDPLQAGGTAKVCITGSSHGGQTITVDVDNGEGQSAAIAIELDSEGKGCANWTVPSWDLANFNYSTCPEVTIPIDHPSP